MKWDSNNLNAAHTMRELDEIPQPPYAILGVGVEEPERGTSVSGRQASVILTIVAILITAAILLW